MPTKTTNPFTSHRVALIRHCTASDLRAFKWFLYLLEVRKQAQVRSNFMSCCAKRCKRREDIYVYFPRISLRGHWVSKGKAGKGCDEFIKRFDLGREMLDQVVIIKNERY